MHNFRELKVWGKAMQIVEDTYAISKVLPRTEEFNFISQLNRSALSIPSNIAEGAGRETKKEFSRFLDIALGSSYELETQLILVNKIFNIETQSLRLNIHEMQKMSISLKRSMINTTY